MAERPDNHGGATAFVALIAIALALIAAPSAFGAKPARTVITPEPMVFPAGFACAFAVSARPDEDASVAITEFSDGLIQMIGHALVTLTNLDTGASIAWRSRHKLTQTYDPEANDVLFEDSGRFVAFLFPGDAGPDGAVGENGALLGVVGHAQVTLDLDTDVVTAFLLSGEAIDLCLLLSD